jgi:hypothetical protein
MTKMDIEDKLTMIEEYAECHSYFDMKFINSLKTNFIKYGRLSENQENAIDNIIKKCYIQKWYDKR